MKRTQVECIKLDEEDIRLLNEICNMKCRGVDCRNCDLYDTKINTASVESCFKHAINRFF